MLSKAHFHSHYNITERITLNKKCANNFFFKESIVIINLGFFYVIQNITNMLKLLIPTLKKLHILD